MPSRYPFDSWVAAVSGDLAQGTDFECSVPAMRSRLCEQARRRGLKVTTSAYPARPGVIAYAFYGEGGATPHLPTGNKRGRKPKS